MMSTNQVAHAYIQYLEEGNLDQLLRLFTVDSVVDSPIYGVKSPRQFYGHLLADTKKSQLELISIFEDSESQKLALYFNYQWTLRNGKEVNFEVVDILEFNSENKIANLKIIYDTVNSRRLINDQSKQL